MPRRSSNSFRSLSLPAILILGAIVGCRNWQEKAESPKSTPKPRRTSSPSIAPPISNQRSSNEGNLLLGNPSDAGQNVNNFLLDRPQFSLSYHRDNGGPNWVAWHTDISNLGDLDRGKFAPDPGLPSDSQIRPSDYKGSGYDRGHVCPSGDRTASREANNATFWMSNMLPQTGALNRNVWADLENYVRDEIRAGNEAYQVAGGAGSAGRIGKGKINVPQICWKVVVFLPVGNGDLRRIGSKTRVVAVGMPNVEDKRLETGDWRSYLTSVDKLESAIKLDLLSNLPDSVEKQLEARTDSGN
ncbi:MAG TPA: DNA/RNA non-specific endonuclease [Abditibacterium sp.]|jgi:endonuclease G